MEKVGEKREKDLVVCWGGRGEERVRRKRVEQRERGILKEKLIKKREKEEEREERKRERELTDGL